MKASNDAQGNIIIKYNSRDAEVFSATWPGSRVHGSGVIKFSPAGDLLDLERSRGRRDDFGPGYGWAEFIGWVADNLVKARDAVKVENTAIPAPADPLPCRCIYSQAPGAIIRRNTVSTCPAHGLYTPEALKD